MELKAMKKNLLLIGTICAGLGLSGCSSAPGTSGQQGAVVGGATGAAVGASVTKNRALGAVIGGAVGAAGGYVVGNKTGPLDKKKDNSGTPAPGQTGEYKATGATADLNNDGFVTLDEIVKLEKNGESDEEIVRRISATGLTFDLNDEQRKYLSDHGVSQYVISQLPSINRSTTTTTTTTSSPGEVISR
jgi:osmotically inducible lipoprotein OsmB